MLLVGPPAAPDHAAHTQARSVDYTSEITRFEHSNDKPADSASRAEPEPDPTSRAETEPDSPETQTIEFALHTALASRWTHYVANGLDSLEKLALKNKYSLPKNCLNLQEPILNSELMPALPALIVKKNNHALSAQQQVDLTLAPLDLALKVIF